ncbi:MAG: amidase [Planctomycetota bacterium]|jgi:Asp-tRNA(Asn)/Glu-tRNA(Gln) amidotransferase A subunit family amidase
MGDNNPRRSTRREFIVSGSAAAAACTLPAAAVSQSPETASPPPSGSGDTPRADDDGPPITRATITEAEKLAAVEFTDEERALILEGLEDQLTRYRRRQSVELTNDLAPATVFDPRLPGTSVEQANRVVPSSADPGPLPLGDRDIAYAPVTALSAWIQRRELTSTRLTEIYLDRLRRHGPQLECVVTLTEKSALDRARRADIEIAAGRVRSRLHGIPWGAKDLFDTAGVRTTWGARPYRDRVPERDAAVVRRLDEAGAVLVGKLTLGALAYGDIWFGGRTNNPWKLDQGSRGSSAGSAAGTAAGLVGFALGTETYGSIVSPCMRCGTTGLRPTFGRVARTGAMALCWSLDKIGPICRTVEDCALVLAHINGADPGDPSSIDVPFEFDATQSVARLRVGYAPKWFDGQRVTDVERRALDAARGTGVNLVEIELPDWPYDTLMTILRVEAAAAFEELTLSDRDDELKWQAPQAWPNFFRQARFAPGIEYVQAQRFRRQVMEMMATKLADVDAIISPSFAGSLLMITNHTGHPSLTLRCGFREDGTPRGITLWGRLFDEGTLCRLGMALEGWLHVWGQRPPM